MIQSEDVREHVAALLRKDIRLSAFERWLDVQSIGMFEDSDENAIKLVAAVSLLLSELQDDIIDDSVFVADLRELINDIEITLSLDAPPLAQPSHTFSRLSATKTDWLSPPWLVLPV